MMVAALVFLLGATMAHAQTVAPVTGNGQVICSGCQNFPNFSFQTMVVKVTDASGNPLSGQTVTWTTSGSGAPLCALSLNGNCLSNNTTTTAADGTSLNYLTATNTFNPNAFSAFVQYVVNAACTSCSNNASTNFTLTQGFVDPQTQIGAFQIFASCANCSYPSGGAPLAGKVGDTYSPPLVLGIVDRFGRAVPNAGMLLVNIDGNGNLQNGATGPTATCTSTPGNQPGLVLSDANGFFTCSPVFGGQPNVPASGGAPTSVGQFYASVGGAYPGGDLTQIPNGYQFGVIRLAVSPGQAGSIKIVSGNNQSVTIGGPATLPLVVEVDNTSGTPLAGVGITWKVTPTGAITNTANAPGVTDQNGRASWTPTVASSASGAITITASVAGSTTAPATFTLTAAQPVIVTSLAYQSGSNQSAVVNSAFPLPLVVKVSVSSGSVQGIPVQFAVTQGAVTISATTANTDANGLAQVTATAGSVTGSANVVASIPSFVGAGSVTFILTVAPSAPTLNAGSFVNGADYQGNSLSPCSLGALVTAAGTLGISPISPAFPFRPAPSTALTIMIGTIPAPVLNITNNLNGQQLVEFQVPCNVAVSASVPASVSIGGGVSTVNLNIQVASPGVFQDLGSDGVLRAVLIRPDGSFASITNPARQGENVTAVVTGLGPTNPPETTLNVASPTIQPVPTGIVVVGVAGGGTTINSVQSSTDLTGVFLVNFLVPTGQTGNNVPFSVGVIPPGSSPSSPAIQSVTSRISIQ
jgi:uncharacterized protein (TIGR03437 family)